MKRHNERRIRMLRIIILLLIIKYLLDAINEVQGN
jgi:hypothetical protein